MLKLMSRSTTRSSNASDTCSNCTAGESAADTASGEPFGDASGRREVMGRGQKRISSDSPHILRQP